MTSSIPMVLGIVLLGTALSACDHGERRCKSAETADLMYSLGMAHALVWKAPHAAVSKIHVTESLQALDSAPAKLNAARFPQKGHERMSRLIADMKAAVAAMQSQMGSGPATPQNTGPTGGKLQDYYGNAIQIIREECRK